MPLPKPPQMGQVPQPVRSYGGGQTFGDRGSNAANLGRGIGAIMQGLAGIKRKEETDDKQTIEKGMKAFEMGMGQFVDMKKLGKAAKRQMGDIFDFENPDFQTPMQSQMAPPGTGGPGYQPQQMPTQLPQQQKPNMLQKAGRALGFGGGSVNPDSMGSKALNALMQQSTETGNTSRALQMAQLQAQMAQSQGIVGKQKAIEEKDLETLGLYHPELQQLDYFNALKVFKDPDVAARYVIDFEQKKAGVPYSIAMARIDADFDQRTHEQKEEALKRAHEKWDKAGGQLSPNTYLDYEKAILTGDSEAATRLGKVIAAAEHVDVKRFKETQRHNRASEAIQRDGQVIAAQRYQLDFLGFMDDATNGKFEQLWKLRSAAMESGNSTEAANVTAMISDIWTKNREYELKDPRTGKVVKGPDGESIKPFANMTPDQITELVWDPGFWPWNWANTTRRFAPNPGAGLPQGSPAPQPKGPIQNFWEDLAVQQQQFYEMHKEQIEWRRNPGNYLQP